MAQGVCLAEPEDARWIREDPDRISFEGVQLCRWGMDPVSFHEWVGLNSFDDGLQVIACRDSEVPAADVQSQWIEAKINAHLSHPYSLVSAFG